MIAVADAFDSMTSTRSYRGARSVPDALSELRRCAGTQFDLTFVEALVIALESEGWASEIAAVPERSRQRVRPRARRSTTTTRRPSLIESA